MMMMMMTLLVQVHGSHLWDIWWDMVQWSLSSVPRPFTTMDLDRLVTSHCISTVSDGNDKRPQTMAHRPSCPSSDVNHCRHNLAPLYLANDLHWTDESEALRRLRSGARWRLILLVTRLCTIGDWAFGVAAACVWNNLPPIVTSASSLPSFKRQMKTFLLRNLFP